MQLSWLRPDRAPDAFARVFESAVEEFLRSDANWSVEPRTLKPAADPRPQASIPGAAQVTLLSCDRATCPAEDARPPDLEILNARMLARPLYIFVKDPKVLGKDRVSVAVMLGEKAQLPEKELEHFLSEILHKPVSLQPVKSADALAVELAGVRRDAVALFGEEPYQLMDDFRDAYGDQAPGAKLRLLSSGFETVSLREFRQADQADIQYILLEYPRDAFYADLAPADTQSGLDPVTVGLAAPRPEGQGAGAALPLLLTDARSLARKGDLPACCLQALRRAVGNAALVAARPRAASQQRPVSVARDLLTYALLSERDGAKESLDALLRASALAGYLTTSGEPTSASLVLRSVGQQDYDSAQKAIEREMERLNLRGELRHRFARDAAGLIASARRSEGARRAATSPAPGREAVAQLVAATRAEPAPAAHKPGSGLSHADDYNPYLELAQSWTLHRAELTASAPEGGPRVSAAGEAEPACFYLAAAVIGLEATTGGEPLRGPEPQATLTVPAR